MPPCLRDSREPIFCFLRMANERTDEDTVIPGPYYSGLWITMSQQRRRKDGTRDLSRPAGIVPGSRPVLPGFPDLGTRVKGEPRQRTTWLREDLHIYVNAEDESDIFGVNIG